MRCQSSLKRAKQSKTVKPDVKTRIVFRIDDFKFINNPLQNEILQCFVRHNIPLSVGFVPFSEKDEVIFDMDEELFGQWKIWEEQGLLEPVVHGYNHRANTPLGQFSSEFVGLPFQVQLEKISKSKSAIETLFQKEGIATTFIPPWNRYDKVTEQALVASGIKILSANLSGGISEPELNYYPCTTENFSGIENYVKRLNRRKPALIIVLFHPYSFKKYSLNQLDVLLTQINDHPFIEVTSFKKLLEEKVESLQKPWKAFIISRMFSNISLYRAKCWRVMEAMLMGISGMIGFAIVCRKIEFISVLLCIAVFSVCSIWGYHKLFVPTGYMGSYKIIFLPFLLGSFIAGCLYWF